jgi:RsiW-degrading membrane proteinase PrsW (M82 family)
MDKQTLITIVITVVITAIIKELFAWIISSFKSAAIIGTAKQKLARLFTKTNLAIAADLFAIFLYGGVLVHFALDSSEPSRIEILIAVISAFLMLFMMFSFLIHVFLAKSEKRNP